MGIQFFDLPEDHQALFPLTYTRPLAELQVGIFTIREKWLKFLETEEFGFSTVDYLSAKYEKITASSDSLLWINGGILPDEHLVGEIKKLKRSESLFKSGIHLVTRGAELSGSKQIEFAGEVSKISHPWDIFRKNGEEIRKDISWIKSGCSSNIDDPHTIVYGDQIYLEPGAKVKAAILNSEGGPIYIGKNAEIGEGCMVRGPFALGEGSVLSMGTKIRPDSAVGPFCKVGGEVSNSVIMAYSNKAHDGFLGNSVIGQWCNMGADTNNSNLKNNYGEVKMWDYAIHDYIGTGLQFCGLIMGDHSKTGINTMFNTGSSVGVSCSVFGGGYPPTFIPSFSWGGKDELTTNRLSEALDSIRRVLARRKMELSKADESILHYVFNETLSLRH